MISNRKALAALLPTALLFAALDLWLFLDGHQPSFTGNGISAQDYYLWQSIGMLPLIFLGWKAAVFAGHKVAIELGGEGTPNETGEVLGLAQGIAIGLCYVLPDTIAYSLWGFSSLAKVARLGAPLTLIVLLILSAKGLQRTHFASASSPKVKAWSVAIIAWIAQAIVLIPWLR